MGQVLLFRKGVPAVYGGRVGVFDTTDHDILFHRLEQVFGIQNSALSFFQSYLTERK